MPKGSCLTKRGIEMSEKNGVEGECEDDELRKEAEGAVGCKSNSLISGALQMKNWKNSYQGFKVRCIAEIGKN